ncbi:MAG: hypothetical protein V7L02_03030 [Nostoc sp.]|uniref:hypothetical protein n=1 Tax=unclassified Nostoc TaxID=2593658 RepID=UPI001D71478B|nr:hypothetical protein [Nostoc sp. JL34]MBN3882551.1 hypothetical protein [Nostoc sp. JL34]
MATSISWDLFESTYLRPQISDVYGAQYDEDTLKKTTSASIVDLVSKGLVDIGPLPSTTVIPATAQITYLNPSQVTIGNKFSFTYNNTSISFTATAATVGNVTSNLTSLINANSTFNTKFTAYDDSTRIRLVGTNLGESQEFYTLAERDLGTGNPVLELIINNEATDSELLVTDLTILTADHADAFTTLAAGVKYFLVSDPVVKLQTAAGLDIQKNEALTTACKANYETLILAYLRIHILNEITASAFWKEKLQVSSTQTANTSGQLTLAERLAIIEAEKNAKLEEIAREEDKALAIGDQKRLSSIELKQVDKAYELENKAALIERTATNGAWTSAGQFTISYLDYYATDLEDTVSLIVKDFTNSDYGIPSILQTGNYEASIPVINYKRLDISIVASANITFKLQELVGIEWEDVSLELTDNAIVKSYSLVNTSLIKIVITGLEANTELVLSGQLHSN